MHHRALELRGRLHAEVPYFRASPALRARVLAGMDWLAVSDVSADVLTAFVERLARSDGVQ